MKQLTFLNYRRWGALGMLAIVAVAGTGCAELSALNPFDAKYEPAPRESVAAEEWVYRVGPGDCRGALCSQELATRVIHFGNGRGICVVDHQVG